MPSQLQRLAKKLPPALIKEAPKGKYGSYVPHDIILQKLLAALGPIDFEVTELVRGVDGRIEGCLARMTCEIDGRRTTIVEVGDCENPDNWKTEGGRMKDAASDAFKRCAMRLGCALHLWSGQDYFLDQQLDHAAERDSTKRFYGTGEDETRVFDPNDPERPFIQRQNTSLPLVDRAVVNAIVDASDEERMGQVPMALDEAQAIADSADRRPYKNTAAL